MDLAHRAGRFDAPDLEWHLDVGPGERQSVVDGGSGGAGAGGEAARRRGGEAARRLRMDLMVR